MTDQLKQDIQTSKLKRKASALNKQYKQALQYITSLENELDAVKKSESEFYTHKIKPVRKGGEATAFIIASDWHIDERVKRGQVAGMNCFNPKIAKQRVDNFFRNSLTLLNITSRDVAIPTIVLGLLGDFISGSIHEEGMESNTMLPIDAMITAQGWIASGIDFLLENTKSQLVVPCCTGNHSRITNRMRHATEQGNSLEFFMYKNLEARYKDNKRVKFVVSEGYHTYMNVYGKVVRFHHGTNVRYLGGIGGLSVPLLRAIAQWNRGKKADIDVLGHHHQFKDYGSAVVNGSLVGYNAYALSIKAEYEPPRQTFFLLDKVRGKTIVAPIIVEGN